MKLKWVKLISYNKEECYLRKIKKLNKYFNLLNSKRLFSLKYLNGDNALKDWLKKY